MVTRANPIVLTADDAPLRQAIASLEALAKRSPKSVKRFLGVRKNLSKLVRIDPVPAVRAGECRFTLYPSERLAKFLAANGAGNG
jgi:hypothetical protein